MNKQFVKNIYEKTPSGIKRLFSRTIRNRLINNKVFRKQYDLLVRAEQMRVLIHGPSMIVMKLLLVGRVEKDLS